MTGGPLEEALGQAVTEALREALPGVVDALYQAGGPRAYSVAEVARRLGISDGVVYRLIHEGHLPTVPHLNPMRVAARALEEFLSRTDNDDQVTEAAS